MAANCFLKFGDIEGESKDKDHGKETEILSFNVGASNPVSFGSGSGGGKGTVNFGDINISKYVDKSSPNLLKSCISGEPKDATITIRKQGGKGGNMDYLKINLTNAVVSSFSCSGSDGAGLPTESVGIGFEKINFQYCPQKDDSTLDAPVEATYDVSLRELT